MIKHKRGSYFGYLVRATDADNLDADFTGSKVRCKIKTPAGALVHNFGELDLSADGSALLQVQPEISITWPAGLHKTDLVYVDAQGRLFATKTIDLTIVKEVTGITK